MGAFGLLSSLESSTRFAEIRRRTRRPRSDRGRSRMGQHASAELVHLLSGHDRPRMSEVLRALSKACARNGEPSPSRASIYQWMARAPLHNYVVGDLPAPVKDALYNLVDASLVPGHQLAFYCFNYGTLSAMSFAASLPWIDLYQADRMRGWRPTARGLFDSVLRARGL